MCELEMQEGLTSGVNLQGSLDTYRFCDEVWTFLIKNVTFKMDNGSVSVQADKVKIVSCNAKRPGEGQ
jgi:transcription initiation factor TFIIA small subunit